jgi:hypothetical protein
MDCWINSAAPFLACSDFENASLRRSLTEQARNDRTTLLFACLHGHSARVGPLITPLSQETLSSHYLTRSWDFSRTDTSHPFMCSHESPFRLHLAQIGATFIIGELANLLYGEHTSPYDRVIKIDSPTEWAGHSPQAFPDLHPGTLAMTDDWQSHLPFPTRVWHHATP